MKKLLGIVVAAGLCSAVFADDTPSIGIQVRIGYQFGDSFRLNNGKTGNLNGPTVGLDFAFSHAKGLTLAFSPSIVLAGQLSHGGDTDGRAYRFTLSAMHDITRSAYGRLEAGFAHTESRGTQFDDVDDFIVGAAVGFRLGHVPAVVKHFQPSLEIGGFISRQRQLSGATVLLNFGF